MGRDKAKMCVISDIYKNGEGDTGRSESDKFGGLVWLGLFFLQERSNSKLITENFFKK